MHFPLDPRLLVQVGHHDFIARKFLDRLDSLAGHSDQLGAFFVAEILGHSQVEDAGQDLHVCGLHTRAQLVLEDESLQEGRKTELGVDAVDGVFGADPIERGDAQGHI